MPLRRILKDKVTLIKQDGKRFADIQASVQRDKIFTYDAKIPIEDGDAFERILPSGTVEHYTILDAGYFEGVGGIKGNFQSVVRKQKKIEPHQTGKSLPEKTDEPDPQKVFVVHGRDERLRGDFFAFLRALNLQPIEWSEALKLTGKASPYIGEILDCAFNNAQAVIVLLTPDDEVRLHPELWHPKEESEEKEYRLQARPNVLFEAGMAFGRNPDRTLLIEVGRVKVFSDVAGRHVIRLTNGSGKRNDVAKRLETAGCAVSTVGEDWLKEGDFIVNRGNIGAPQKKHQEYLKADLTEGDILALLEDWWPESGEQVPNNVKVEFNKVDISLSLPPGSTKKYIGQIAERKSFKCISSGNFVAVYEYDVDTNFFGTYHNE